MGCPKNMLKMSSGETSAAPWKWPGRPNGPPPPPPPKPCIRACVRAYVNRCRLRAFVGTIAQTFDRAFTSLSQQVPKVISFFHSHQQLCVRWDKHNTPNHFLTVVDKRRGYVTGFGTNCVRAGKAFGDLIKPESSTVSMASPTKERHKATRTTTGRPLLSRRPESE